jgi:hypothetical protein
VTDRIRLAAAQSLARAALGGRAPRSACDRLALLADAIRLVAATAAQEPAGEATTAPAATAAR